MCLLKGKGSFLAVFTKPRKLSDLPHKQPLIPKWLCDVRIIKETLSYNSFSRSWKPKCFLFYISLIYVQTYCRPTNQFLIFFLSNSKYPSANKPFKGRFCEILQICHDNQLTIFSPRYFFPCQRWLSVKEDDGQISRELVPVDASLKNKLGRQDSQAVRKEIALETKGGF